MEEIRDVTWGLWGVELKEWQAIQRLYLAGFRDAQILAKMFAVIEGESGSYTKAWHANVMRESVSKGILYDSQGRMTIKSVDLGFIQRNVALPAPVAVDPTPEAMKPVIEELFERYPRLARADHSSEEAWLLFQDRGFSPWYAYKPGTPEFKAKVKRGAKAVGNYLNRVLVDDGDKLIWRSSA